MANTEKVMTLKKVRKAKRAAMKARRKRGLDEDERARLEQLYDDLESLEDDLILREVDKQIDKLEAATEKLGGVAEGLRRDIANLEKVADLVDDAAKAVGALVKVAQAAAGLV